MTLSDLSTLGDWMKLSALYREAGLSPNRMRVAASRGRELTPDEDEAIRAALRRFMNQADEILGKEATDE